MASARTSIMGTRHVVSAGHYLAAHAGFEILEAGGNAIDAGVAAGIAIDVLQTDKVNFGGVAPQIIFTAKNRKVHCIDGLGVWPRGVTPDYFLKKHGGKISPDVERCIVSAAPDAWLTALANFGTMSFGEVASAAIRFASEGFPMHALMSEVITENSESYRQGAATRKRFRMGMDYWRGEDRFMRAKLGQIKVPSLVLWGRQDKLIPVEAAELVNGPIPGAQLIV